MASSRSLRERLFALSGAILFFVSAIAVSVVVIVQVHQDGKQRKATEAATAAQTACKDPGNGTALAAPEAFKPEGDVTTLQKTDLTTGSGAAAKNGDCLIVKYYGTLATDGTNFDENYTKTSAFAFVLGNGQVIQGWDQGLVGMQAGGERRLVIPSDLAYGTQGQGSIPANADLVFAVKLLKIQK